MSDFYSRRTIKATRKPHACNQCGKVIVSGSPAEYGSGMYEGYLYSLYDHIECHEAASAYAKLNDLYGEEWPNFQYMDDSGCDHLSWLRKEYPVVAERLGAGHVRAA